MRRRVNRLMGGGRIVLWDAFTDADGTILPNHAPASGGPWLRHVLFTAADIAAGDAAIDGNRVHNLDLVTGRYYHLGRHPRRRNGAVAADFVLRSDNDLSFAAVVLCLSPARATMVYARYNANGNLWQILRVRDGATTSLGLSAATLTVGQTYRLVGQRRGSRWLLSVDGALLVTADDPATLSGLPGVRFGDNATATTGVHLDNWIATR